MSDCAPPLDPTICFALLAAGRGRRFGGSKLDADLGGMPLWRWAARSAEQAGFRTCYLIVADTDVPDGASHAEGWEIAVNARADEGIAASIRLACRLAQSSHRLVIALADMPFVEAAHLRRLALGSGVMFTRYPPGRNGVPAGFPRSELRHFAALRGDRGAAALNWTSQVETVPVPPETLLDVDCKADLLLARKRSLQPPS